MLHGLEWTAQTNAAAMVACYSQESISVTRWLVSLFFKIWPFTSMKIAQRRTKFVKVSTKVCKINPHKMPKTIKILPKWRKLVKSGHTGQMIDLC